MAEHYFNAARERDEDPPVCFFYTKGDETSDSLRDFAQVPDEDNLLVILDIPSQKLYVSDAEVLTREVVDAFVNDFNSGKLQGRKLKG